MSTQRMQLVQVSAEADSPESIPTVIVGGSQAGLVMGYRLQEAGEQFVILDAQRRIAIAGASAGIRCGCSRPQSIQASRDGQCR